MAVESEDGQLEAGQTGHQGRLVLKKLFFCVDEYAEYGFDQQRLIWYVCRLWDIVFS